MRQTHPLTDPRHKPERAVERLKNRIRKYLKRERKKTLPEEYDYWDFDCRAGDNEALAEPIAVGELMDAIDAAVSRGAESVYLEILAKPMKRAPKAEKSED